MSQNERREWLIRFLLEEQPERYAKCVIPANEDEQFYLLRGLMNLRPPMPVSEAFLRVQDDFLQEEIRKKGVTDANTLSFSRGMTIWRGDITTLRCDAIVNAANSALLGCFCPNHGCIDNAIHTFSGVQLRLACKKLMEAQGFDEPTGRAKITPGFNLPARYVLHTVGPIVHGNVTRQNMKQLASCYRACLDAAAENQLKSIAFCCISTGEFHFPNELAAQIAIQTAAEHKAVKENQIRVIFNVFKACDAEIYHRLLENPKFDFMEK